MNKCSHGKKIPTKISGINTNSTNYIITPDNGLAALGSATVDSRFKTIVVKRL